MFFHGLLSGLIPGLGEFTQVGDASAPLTLRAASWEIGLNSCSFCSALAVSDAGEGPRSLLMSQGGKAKILCAEEEN